MKRMTMPAAPTPEKLLWSKLHGTPATGAVVGALTSFADGQATMVSLPAAKTGQLISTPLKSLTCNVHYARYAWDSGACESGKCDGEALKSVPLAADTNGVLCIGLTPTNHHLFQKQPAP